MATELGAAIFLSWVRGGLVQNASPPAADAALPRLTANISVDVSSGGTSEAVPARFELYGPADTHGVHGVAGAAHRSEGGRTGRRAELPVPDRVRPTRAPVGVEPGDA